MTKPILKYENDFQQKIMTQSFAEPFTVATSDDVVGWRTSWSEGLKSWHSPYKCVIDCTNLMIQPSADVEKGLQRMVKFLEGFFLRKCAGFGLIPEHGHASLPFPVFKTPEEAYAEIGVRAPARGSREAVDFRGTIQLQNHFNQHVVEMTFSEPVKLSTKEQLVILKSKLTNNLTQWHSKWSLLIDCTNLEFDPVLKEEWAKIEKFLKGFFLKEILGYSAKFPKENYPFEVFRARHNAAGRLESEGNFAGDEANCKSTPKSS